jgi:hypothetical protein
MQVSPDWNVPIYQTGPIPGPDPRGDLHGVLIRQRAKRSPMWGRAMVRIGPNEWCMCGSGKQYERCCGDPRTTATYTADERAEALFRLDQWIEVFAEAEADEASVEFWGPFLARAEELPDDLLMCSQEVEDAWFAFDDLGDRGAPIVDTFLAEAELGDGERAFLTALRNSSMRLYEVVAVAPGTSLTLRDAIEGGEITVNERTASRMLGRHVHVAARVVPHGPSGGPELEFGLLHIPRRIERAVVAQLRELRVRFLDGHRSEDLDAFYKLLPPFFHEAWIGAFLEQEDLQRALQDRLRVQRTGTGAGAGAREPHDGQPPEVAELLMLGFYARHYRAWIDEPVPALDGATPRQAAAIPELRPRLVDLLHQLLEDYQHALRERRAAYDPSWMWAELGLDEREAVRHPPPLMYERVAEAVAGSGELVRAVAERLRRAPGSEGAITLLTPELEAVDLDIQRFLRTGGAAAAPYLRLLIDFELHRRKAFWVDEALAYQLDQTELDVRGRELRVPFAAFGLVFTDRHVLSLAERLLAARDNCPLSGQLLAVATVHVEEHRRGAVRTLELCFALDALGDELPVLVRHELVLEDEAPVQAYLDAIAPRPALDPPPPDTSPIRCLLRTVINAVLYASSASSSPEHRQPPGPPRTRERGALRPVSSEQVDFLPGTIDRAHLRKLQELERGPDGRALVRRHMTRGHWQRPHQSWTDQRLRWSEPYWKGPDMAAIIEQAYRQKP